MPKKRILSPMSVWDFSAVEKVFTEAGVKLAHIMKIYSHLLRNPTSTWHDVPDLPKAAKSLLDSNFAKFTTRLVSRSTSTDETKKLLVELQDGLQVESVIMSYDTTHPAPGCAVSSDDTTGGRRSTLCVSSQVGCAMGCTFCATGTMGHIADLNAGEIIEQLVHANSVTPIRNVVFMGMGEPMNNYPAVLTAVRLMISPVFGLRRRSVTVSTVGVIPRINQMAHDLPGVALALSLHAPTQELRRKIVPSARAYPLDRLMASVHAYQAITKQRVFIEYVMLGPDFNCTTEHAHALGALLKGKDVVINLIPWNPILSPAMDFRAPVAGATEEFKRICEEEYGLPTTVRQEKGQDVAAACGQLVLEQGMGKGGGGRGGGGGGCSKNGLQDMEDLVGRAANVVVER